MINASKKDSVLKIFCEANNFESLLDADLSKLLSETELSFDELYAVLAQFSRLGFISDLNMRRNSPIFYFCLHLEALDFYHRGGFFVQEETLKLTLDKLSLEVSALQAEFPDKAEKFTAIAANIATCLSFMLAAK